jgi:hypothetical protein
MNKGIAAAALALVATLSASSAWADNNAYVEGEDGPFGTIDLNTGVFTSLGSTTLGSTTEFLSGLGVDNGKLYGADFGSGTLYLVNPANGSLTTVGSSGVSYEDLGSTTSGLYEIGKDFNLYSINPANGAATLIGATGLSGFGGVVGVSAGASGFYLTSGSDFYKINTSTGAATLISSTLPEFGAEVEEGGVLYGGQWPAADVDTIDTITGAVTVGPAVTGGLNSFWGLAPSPLTSTVPDETSTISLLAVVCLGGLLLRRRSLIRCA